MPEILNRCDSCGASIREPAMFCPECGKPLANTTPAAMNQSEPQAATVEPAISETSAEASVAAANPVDAKIAEAGPADDAGKAENAVPDGARHGARERTRETLHRASSAARGAIEDNVKRVEKIQHVSAVMLEEASYDPSLRFVLVALGLFIVFVILLVLTKVMG